MSDADDEVTREKDTKTSELGSFADPRRDAFLGLGLPEKYRVLEMLGAGGMGSVYHAHDHALDRPVAIKLLAENYSQNPALVQRFQHEARSVAKLNHPSIVQVYEFGRAGARHFIAMEFIDGRTVAQELEARGAFGEIDAIATVRQACAALAVAHAAGIVHRDVKPDNMMRTTKGEFKLVDLGLAKVVDEDLSKTGTGVAMGTPYYISPEQIRGDRSIDLRTDVYSLGVTMYQLATGHVPFEGTSAPDIMTKHLRDPLPDPRRWTPSLSDAFCRVLVKTMAKDREGRHRDMNELDADLALVAGGGSRPAWAPADLAPIEAALVQSVGPMARVLVAKAAESCGTREELVEQLSREVTSPASRRTFIDSCARGDPRATPVPPTAAAPPRPPSVVPIDPATLAKLTALLTERIGPVARVIVRRTAAKTSDVGALVDELAKQLPDATAREAFVAAARRYPPRA